jgi:hypothetical protein
MKLSLTTFLAFASVLERTQHRAEALSSPSPDFGYVVKHTPTTTQQQNEPPVVSTVDLSNDKSVKLFFPATSRQFSQTTESGTKIATNDGRGDIVWPSGFSLSRLIAHCPALVDGRNVLELGCGLGVVAAAACKYSRPNHVALADIDKSVLALAYASCVQLQRSSASVSRCVMDWKDRSTWPAQNYDVLLGSDILYEKSSILSIVNVLQHYLCSEPEDDGTMKRAIIVDPVNQVNRDAFCYAACKAGLDVEQEGFPGSPELVLLSVTPFL